MIHFAIFAKYWEPGKVKTRLAKTIGAAAACDVYYRFLRHLVEKFGNVGDRRTIVYSPPESQSQFREAISEEWDLAPQSDGDLGRRMGEFFRSNAAVEMKNILIGSDTPHFPVEYVGMAAEWLEECDVVLGPSADGGYYLIAMKQPADAIFENVEWSTDRVLSSTIEKLGLSGMTYKLLPEMKDVDEYKDLRLLVEYLQSDDSKACDKKLLSELMQLELPL